MKRMLATVFLLLACIQCRQSCKPNGGEPISFSSPNSQIELTGLVGKVVTVTVFDVKGRDLGIAFQGIVDSTETIELHELVKVSVDSQGMADTTVVNVDSLSAGVYFYRVKTPESSFTKKLYLLR